MTLHTHIRQLSNTIYNIQSKNSYYSKSSLMYSHCHAQSACLNLNHESRNYSLVVSKITIIAYIKLWLHFIIVHTSYYRTEKGGVHINPPLPIWTWPGINLLARLTIVIMPHWETLLHAVNWDIQLGSHCIPGESVTPYWTVNMHPSTLHTVLVCILIQVCMIIITIEGFHANVWSHSYDLNSL